MATRRTVTLAEVARAVGVSRGAAGRVLLGTGGARIRVSEATAERIRRTAEELGYYPNRIAKALSGGRTGIVGILVDSCAPPVRFRLLQLLERDLAAMGFRVMVGYAHEDSDAFRGLMQDFHAYHVDALVSFVLDYPEEGIDLAEHLLRFPNLVCVEEYIRGRCCVRLDIAAGVEALVQHLVARGYRRIGLDLLRMGTVAHYAARLEGYQRGLRRAGRPAGKALVCESTLHATRSADLAPVAAFVQARGLDAIVGGNDERAAYLIKALARLGLSVPHDVAVTGFDNLPLCTQITPELTSVDQAAPDMARRVARAVQALIRRDARPVAGPVLVPPRLVVRQSTPVRRLS